MADFAEKVLSNPSLVRSGTNVKKNAAYGLVQGVITVVIGAVLTVMHYREHKKVLANKEISKSLSNIAFWSRLNMMISGCLSIYNALSVLYMYQPSNTEISLAILIKYLKKEGHLPPEVYEALQTFKPYRVDALRLEQLE